ncbi:TIGR00730 family Rossman fold protein [Candidatus Parcubacteria bacterium]|nr:TIGR00730 family Rossman fold protein [Candidatus Parcubacteria bacterium]
MTDKYNINLDGHIMRPKHLTPEEIREGCRIVTGGDGTETRICAINEEFRQGFATLLNHDKHEKSITFWGSARLPEGSEYYEKARRLGKRIGELGYTVVTGGGPGIMEGGNRGAFEAGAHSIGATIDLPFEQHTNPYVTEEIPFYFFFSRKVILGFSAEAYLYFPGGFGTFDELFEMLTLVQTKKIPSLPIILVGKDFWEPFIDVLKKQMLEKFETISEEDLSLFKILDDEDEIVEIIKNAPQRDE